MCICGVRAGLVVDPLVDHRALHVVAAEAERDLGEERRHHGPVGLDVGNVVEEEPADRDVLQVLVAGGGGADPAHLLTQLVVVGVVGQRDVGEEAAGLVLQRAQHAEVLDPVLGRLHVAVEHGAVGRECRARARPGAPGATPRR